MKAKRKGLLILAGSILSLAILVFIIFISLGIYAYFNIDFEADRTLFERAKSVNSTTYYASSTPYGDNFDESYTPKKIELSGSLKKEFYSIDEISPYLKEGFLAVEDKTFYEHNGVNLKRTLAALVNTVTKKKKRFGASTITQQVIKNISGDNEIKLTRKLSEIIRAVKIEKYYSKDEIFEVYLNIVPMSENMYGVGIASRSYFGKEPKDLTPAEAATLIGITNATSTYNPYNNPEACREKRNTVLSVMYSDGVITEDEYERAKGEELYVIPRESREDRFNSWFIETVIAKAEEDIANRYEISRSAAGILLSNGGYSVYTTMDTEIQSILEEYFENENNFSKEIKNGLNYSMVITEVGTGNLLGVIGRVGEKRGNRLLNHATAPHTPGSVLKPLGLYAPLIDEGKINWATVLDDTPTAFYKTDGGYREYPHNSPDVYAGLTTVKDAIRLSKNTVAVRLCDMRGAKAVFRTLKDVFGFETLIEKEKTQSGAALTDIATSPMALGQLSHGVSIMKLTESYNVFPSEGVLPKLRCYILITDSDGNTVIENKAEEKEVFKPETAGIMNQLLKTVTEDGTAGKITLKNKIDTAAKTGTSGNNRDKMIIGYTPYYVGGIWCGYESGGSVASVYPTHITIWDDVMQKIHDTKLKNTELKSFSTDNLVSRPYCRDSGEIYSDNCVFDPRGSRMEYGYFTKDNQPTHICARHVLVDYDTETKGIATESCPMKNLAGVALIAVYDRAFPIEVYITDAEYVYRDTKPYGASEDSDYPYFYSTLPEGEYAGISKRRRQFNAPCREHE